MSEICEWFKQYIDWKDRVIVTKFSDGTVKKTKCGDYLNDVEEGIAYQVGYKRGLEAGRRSFE